MRILLDENVPVQLKPLLVAERVDSLNQLGWKQLSNGRLLGAMEGVYDLLITADQNIYAQQKLAGRPLSILVLPFNRRRDVLDLAPPIQELLSRAEMGSYVVINRDRTVTTRFTGS